MAYRAASHRISPLQRLTGEWGLTAASGQPEGSVPVLTSDCFLLPCCFRCCSHVCRNSGVDDGAYGTSYTNRKTKEYDLLNDIVKQTRKSVALTARIHEGMLSRKNRA